MGLLRKIEILADKKLVECKWNARCYNNYSFSMHYRKITKFHVRASRFKAMKVNDELCKLLMDLQ